MPSIAVKRWVQSITKSVGYRLVPQARDAQTLRRWLYEQPIGTIIDVGASTGITSLDWLNHFPSAIVHAIEPLPESYAALQKLQARAPGRMNVYNCAVGGEIGIKEFRFHPSHPTSSSLLSRTELSAQLLPFTRDEIIIEVPVTTLDDLFLDQVPMMQRESLLKLDVQGVEAEIVAGGACFLKHVKYLLTEVSLAPVYVGQSDFNALHHAITHAGFVIKGFLEQVHLPDMTPLYFDVLYVNNSA